jgi:hypothetical protein
MITLVYMTPQLSRPANLNRPHDPQVPQGHLGTMKLSILWPKRPKNIGDL